MWSVAIVLAATALRLPGLFTDFWLDEVWSWTLVWDGYGASRISGPLGVFTEIHQDNNNHLVTSWMWASGPYAPLWWYRLPSFLAGVALIVVTALVAARWFVRRRRLAAGVAAAIVGFGLMPVAYSSEARGYMLAACAAACAQLALGRMLDRPGPRPVGLFVASSAIGFLSHLTYLPVFVAHGVWGLVSWVRLPRRAGATATRLVAFGAPTALVAWLWSVDLSRTSVGGGPPLSAIGTARDALALPFGADLFEPLRSLAALVTLGLLVRGLVVMRRTGAGESRGAEWIVPATLLVAGPVILFGLAPAGLVYPRHFLVSLALLVPLASGAVAVLFASRVGRVVAIPIAVLFLATNLAELVPFLRDGRGDWVALLEQIERESPDGLVPIGSDHDFRNGMLVEFHRTRSRGTSRLRYIQQDAWSRTPPAWMIVHALERTPEFPLRLTDDTWGEWTLLRSAPCGGPTGTVWGVYSAGRR